MSGKRVGAGLALVFLYSGLTVLFTYPLVWFFATHHVGEVGGDARVYLWNMWWVDKVLTELHTDPFETDFIFYPLGIGLSLHTLGFAQGLAFVPLKLLLGEVAAANSIVALTFVVSALGMYALARYLGASTLGSFLAGMAFAFCPSRLARLAGHYDLLGTEWIPLYALVFLKALREEKLGARLLVGAAALAAVCGYTSLTYLAFLALFSGVYLTWEIALRPRRAGSLLTRFASITLMTSVLLLPLLFQLHRDLSSWHYPPYPGSDRYGADLAAYAVPGPRQNLLGDSLGRSFDTNLTEATIFPGYAFLLVLAGALASQRVRRDYAFWIVAAGVFFLLSLGSSLKIAGREPGIPLPFALFQELPLLDQLRAPSRLSVVFMLCAAVLLAVTWSAWMERIRQPERRLLLSGALATIMIAEHLAIPIPVFKAGVAPVYRKIAAEKEDFTVVEIPGVEQVPGRLMYHQTVHGKRILIGTAARVPPEKMAYYFGLPLIRPLVDLRKGKIPLSAELIEKQKELAPRVAGFLSLRYFIVERAFVKRGVLDFLERVLPLERSYEDEERVALRVREDELPAAAWNMDAGAEDSRMYFESGWSRPEEAEGRRFRWANEMRSTVLLKRPEDGVRQVVLDIAALESTQLQVDARLDGASLGGTTLSSGWNEIRWTLPAQRAREIERLVLRWSGLRRASDEDPRQLAARVASIRFE
jgi:hypothetical protein